MAYSYYLSTDLVCLVWAVFAVTYILSTILPRARKVITKVKNDGESIVESVGKFHPVSIIIYSPAWCEQLAPLIHDIFAQQYSEKFEVIVVNGEKDSRTEDEILKMQIEYPDLYLTFSPQKSKNLSPKKLALTIGIKAAKYENLIITHSNVALRSELWLKAMARHFGDGKSLVLGFSKIDGCENKGEISKMQSYDFGNESLRWLSYALADKPIRGTAYNIAYTKKLFFSNKGFSEHLNLMYGDDDLYVDGISSLADCAVELSPQSMVTVNESTPGKFYNMMKMGRIFTSQYLSQGSYRIMGSVSFAAWIWLISSVCALVFTDYLLFVPISVGALFFTLWVPLMLSYRVFYRALGIRPLLLSIPFLMLFHPFYSLTMRRKMRKNKESYYAWGVYRPF